MSQQLLVRAHKIDVDVLIREIDGIFGQNRSINHCHTSSGSAIVAAGRITTLLSMSDHALSGHVIPVGTLTCIVSKTNVEYKVLARKSLLNHRRVIPIKVAPEGTTDLCVTVIGEFDVGATRFSLLQVRIEI